MELNEKLQELRKQKGLTQEELAQALYVSRTAVSKWEAGRGYPNIDSLKAIAKFFSVTVDSLLSGEELLTVAEADGKEKEKRYCNLVFGALHCGMVLLLFLPFFGQKIGGEIHSVSLLMLSGVSLWLKIAYFVVIVGISVLGVLTFALQNGMHPVWESVQNRASFLGTALGTFLFMVSRQPYAAAFSFVFLLIQVLLLGKKR